MSEYLIQGETLTGIADAIRGKTGGTAPVAVSDMAAQINGIQAGGGGDDVLNAMIDGSITEISSNATIIRSYAFYGCTALTTVNFPVATSIGGYVFKSCTALTTVNLPAATSLSSNLFEYCSTLTIADFPVATSIGSYVFRNCSELTTVILRSETMANLGGTNAFTSTPIASGTGYIYVPAALIEDYKAATNWSTYAAQFRALEDYTVDGTTTGELDPTKTGT